MTKITTTDLILEHYQRPEVLEVISKWFDNSRWLIGDTHWWIPNNDEGNTIRPRDLARDYAATVEQYKVLYGTLNRFDRLIFDQKTVWDASKRKPENEDIGTLADTLAYTLGIDIDTIEGPEGKNILTDAKWRTAAETMGQYFLDKLRDSGIEKSVHCLYSGGGIYIFIHHELCKTHEDWDASTRIKQFGGAVIHYNAFIADTQDKFFEAYPQFRGIVKADALNNRKRLFKSIFSLHLNKKVAVIPLDKNNFKLNIDTAKLPLSDEIIESGRSWYEEFDINEKDALNELLNSYGDSALVLDWLKSSSLPENNDESMKYISDTKVPIHRFCPLMKNILENTPTGRGRHTAFAIMASFLKQSGWTKEEAQDVAVFLANKNDLDMRYFWDTWRDNIKCPNCDIIQLPAVGYPKRNCGGLGLCVPDENCTIGENANPINYGWHRGNIMKSQDNGTTSDTTTMVKGADIKIKKDKELQSDKLMRIAGEDGLQLWHNTDHEAYATINIDTHGENFAVKSSSFRNWLSRLLYTHERRVPGNQVLSDVINTMSGNAEFDGEEFETYNRVAEHDGKIYVDMGDPTWRAIEISQGSWNIISNPPVKFVRSRGMLALPEPERGGKLSDLKKIINAKDENNWILIAAWMTQAFWPRGPYVHLSIGGEQGSLKTSMTRMLKMIMDPSKTALRRMPRTEEEMMIAAKRERVLSFDNLSGITKEMSDALCSLATGGSFGKRALYENDEEHSITAMRPAILNGLDAIGSRNDLLDRSIVIELTEAEKRSSQAKIDKQFEELRPKIIGALLDITAYGWDHPIQDEPEDLPRMADFTLWVMACEKALGWDIGTFLAVYNESRDTTLEDAINDDRLANAIKAHAALYANKKNNYEYSVKSTDLFKELCDAAGVDRNHPPRGWPSTVQLMGRAVSRISLGMRKQGYHIISKRDDTKRRLKIITLDKRAIEEIGYYQITNTKA